MADRTGNGRRDAGPDRPESYEPSRPGSERHDVGRRQGWDFGDPYDRRNSESGGFGYGGSNGSAGGFGAGGNGPQTGAYGSQANYGSGYFSHSGSESEGPYDLHDRQSRQGGYNAQYPYSGQGRGDPYGQGSRPRGRDRHHDQYLEWRDNHVRSLDAEYEAYRQEHQAKFDDDFGTWRSNRGKQPKAPKDNPSAGGQSAERAKKEH
jgi:hypothetical protein